MPNSESSFSGQLGNKGILFRSHCASLGFCLLLEIVFDPCELLMDRCNQSCPISWRLSVDPSSCLAWEKLNLYPPAHSYVSSANRDPDTRTGVGDHPPGYACASSLSTVVIDRRACMSVTCLLHVKYVIRNYDL